jgi:Arc/MetJ-type ribon-helix-helix transcriptional regulator
MKKTTIYLPDDLKERVEKVAKIEGKSEADVIRDAISNAVGLADAPQPRLPLTKKGLGDPTLAERIDELMESFGR